MFTFSIKPSGWEEGAHGRSFTHAVNSILMNNDEDSASAGGTIPQLLEKHEFHGSTDGLILMRLARKMMGASLFDKDDASSKLDLMMDTMYQFVSECNDDEVRKGIAPLPGAIQTLETLASYDDVVFTAGLAGALQHLKGIILFYADYIRCRRHACIFIRPYQLSSGDT